MDGENYSSSSAVDPELKAFITNLVSALGGPDLGQSHKPYKLGDDALACLRDIKKWIKGYDERLDRWDVARAISETSLMTFDLLEILTRWELAHQNGDKVNKHMDRIALACLELLVPLTWPLELNKTTSTNNHYKHAPYLNAARVRYKKAILNHPQKAVLRAIIRLAVPVLRTELKERTVRDEGILKLVVYFFRNLLAIDPPESQLYDVNNDVSRSNTIISFQEQDVLDFLNLLASGMGKEFVVQDTPVLESLFYLLRGIEACDLYSDVAGGAKKTPANSSLQELLEQEKELKRKIHRNGSSRHSRFGTMVSMNFQNEGRYTVSGQTALTNTTSTLEKLDANKKWRKPLRSRKGKGGAWDIEVPMNDQAKSELTTFIENFLDGGFNSLFTAIRKLIEQDVERLLDAHKMHYLFLVGWCLEAELLRRKRQKLQSQENDDFGVVAAALHQNNFIVVMKLMGESFERGEKQNFDVLYASIVCFTQILYVIKDMERSVSEDDQDVAENMKLRLFYEETSLNVLAQLPKAANAQSEAFLKAAIELNHILMKMLGAFSEQHTVLYIRTKRRRRKAKKQKQQQKQLDGSEEPAEYNDDIDNEGESEEEAERITSDRKFEFSKFEDKFFNEDTLDSYKRFLRSYNELTPQEIKWPLTFFHRMFVKRGIHSLLFSLDFMKLLDMILSSRDGLPSTHKSRPEVENFTKYYMMKLRESLVRTPSLYVELLFPKISNDIYYLDHGHDDARRQKNKYAAAMEFTQDGLTEEQKISIVVASLLDEDKMHLVEWITEKLEDIIQIFSRVCAARGGTTVGYAEELKTGPEETDKANAIEKDSKFRLLLDLLGFEIPHLNNKKCYMPGDISIGKMQEWLRYLKIYMVERVDLEGLLAADYLKKKNQRQSREGSHEVDNYDENDGFIDNDEDDEDNMDAFNDARFNALPQEEREKRRRGDGNGDSGKQSKTKKRRKVNPSAPRSVARAIAENQQIKSSKYISISDDESDEERDNAFFESERQLRVRLAEKLGLSTVIPDKDVAESLYKEINSRWNNDDDAQSDNDRGGGGNDEDQLAPSDSDGETNNNREEDPLVPSDDGDGAEQTNGEASPNANENGTINKAQTEPDENGQEDSDNDSDNDVGTRRRRIALSDDED